MGPRVAPREQGAAKDWIPRTREAGCSPVHEAPGRGCGVAEQPRRAGRGGDGGGGGGGGGDAEIVTVTRNGVAAEGSMLGLFSDRLPGRLRREPGLSWGDSVKEGEGG